MKLLALETEGPEYAPAAFTTDLLEAEALALWRLQQEGTVRAAYFRLDRKDAVLELEAPDLDTARRALAALPLVETGLVTFTLIPLRPYDGFERLFR